MNCSIIFSETPRERQMTSTGIPLASRTNPCLRRLHFESSALRRLFREYFVQFNHKRQRIREQKCVFAPEFRPFPLFENVVDLGINSPDLRRNDCFMQLYRFNSCISVKRNQRAERVFVGVAVERADPVRQLFGQHRHDAVREINRGPALKRLAVKRSAWLYIMRNIGDMHTEYIPVAVALPVKLHHRNPSRPDRQL